MFHNVIKFESGFYGIQVISSGAIWRADLIKWDGKRGTSYPYNIDDESNFEMYIDADNTVYYTDKGGQNCRVWCPGSRLNQHCFHLHQINAKRKKAA